MANYSFTTLGFFAQDATDAYGINTAGDIVGTIDGTNGFVYKHGTDPRRLTHFVYPNAHVTVPRAINDVGLVTGWFLGDRGEQGFTSINNGFSPPISYPQASSTKIFGTLLAGGPSVGSVLNPSGTIPGTHGMTFDGVNFSKFDVDPFKDNTVAFGINAAGAIVGTYFEQSGTPHGFVYANGEAQLIDPPPNFSHITLTGINDKFQIVGFATPTTFGGNFGFVYTYPGFNYNGGTFSFFPPPQQFPFSIPLPLASTTTGRSLDLTPTPTARTHSLLLRADAPLPKPEKPKSGGAWFARKGATRSHLQTGRPRVS